MYSQRVHKRKNLCIIQLQYWLELVGFLLRKARFAV